MTALLVIAMVVILITFDVLVIARRRKRGQVVAHEPLLAMRPPQPPYGLFIDHRHGWVRLHADGSLRVGIDDFLADAVGAIDEITVLPVGTKVERGQTLLTLRMGQRKLKVAAPAAGEVVAVNHEAVDSPRTVSADPYGLGWVVGLWARDQKEAITPLQVGSGAVAHLKAEFQRLIDFLTTSTSAAGAPVLADGGLPLRGAVKELDEQAWRSFQQQFLGGEKEQQ